MLDSALSGFLFGLVLATLVGAVFFALIQTSIEKGFKAGMLFAIGVMLSDGMYIVVAYFGTHGIFQSEHFKYWTGMIGGLLLIGFGISSFFSKSRKSESPAALPLSANKTILKGFLLNTLNPFVFFFWFGAMAGIAMKENYSNVNIITFFSFTLATVFSTDLLKAFIALRLKKLLTPNWIVWLHRISGVAMIIFGIRLLLKIV